MLFSNGIPNSTYDIVAEEKEAEETTSFKRITVQPMPLLELERLPKKLNTGIFAVMVAEPGFVFE